jgi:hypothetical protein
MLAFITASMIVLGEKLSGGPVEYSVGLRVMSGAPSLGSSRVRPTLLMVSEILPRTWTARMKRMCGIRALARKAYVSCVSGFLLHGVHRFESPRLSDMSNRLSVAVFT